MSFWDSSAIVPLCTFESRSAAARRLWSARSQPVVWCESVVEIASAFARLRDQGTINAGALSRAEKRLWHLESIWIEISSTPTVIGLARELPGRYKLRAGDSLQLAAALVWSEGVQTREFVSADKKLIQAAEEAGFTTFDLS
jgi:predicted nucleic acid-binding protein